MSIPRRRFALRTAGLLTLGVAALLLLAVGVARSKRSSHSTTTHLDQVPSIILWAWERPEQLNFIDTSKLGVAFLASTIYLRGNDVVTRPRLQPLNVPANTSLVAVTRIEADRRDPPRLTPEQLKKTVAALASNRKLPNVIAVQIDFDATLSERNFYRQLLFELRHELPASMPLSITALASWCQGDNWLDDLPIDEAVPMLFRMGIEERQVRAYLTSGESFNSTKCQSSLGLSTDEPIAGLPINKRTYFFNPRSWTPASVNELLKRHDESKSF